MSWGGLPVDSTDSIMGFLWNQLVFAHYVYGEGNIVGTAQWFAVCLLAVAD